MSKLVYSLVLWPEPCESVVLGDSERILSFDVIFQIYYMDPRFRGQTFTTSSGWYFRSSSAPEVSFSEKLAYLWGRTERASERRTVWTRINAISLDDARSKLADFHAALADWAANFPGFLTTSEDGQPLSEEVQESLLYAEDSEEQPEDEDVDAPPPVDEFHPNKISI